MLRLAAKRYWPGCRPSWEGGRLSSRPGMRYSDAFTCAQFTPNATRSQFGMWCGRRLRRGPNSGNASLQGCAAWPAAGLGQRLANFFIKRVG